MSGQELRQFFGALGVWGHAGFTLAERKGFLAVMALVTMAVHFFPCERKEKPEA